MQVNLPTIEFVTSVFGKTENIIYPDFARMFTLEQGCVEACGECVKCKNADGAAVFSPRNAVLMYESTEFLYDHFRQDGASWDALKAELPRIARTRAPEFYTRFVEYFEGFSKVLSAGDFPRPRSSGEEMALTLTIDEMDARISDAELMVTAEKKILRYPEYDKILLRSEDDFNTELLSMGLMQDQDVSLLYLPSLDGIENDLEFPWMNHVNLHPDKWFDPFWPE